MLIRQKIQIGAAAVIANGLLALGLPGAAFATTCSPIALPCEPGCVTLANCQSIAPPGCTATNVTCLPTGTFCFGGLRENICQYQ
jgi:hypothetical protein